jgi:cytidine deaminase
VGAAVRTADGKTYSGCNVENSSYGGTVCAERTAIWKAVSENGAATRIAEILVVTDATPAWPPCGMCLQVMSEFAGPDMPVQLANLKGETQTRKFREFLPQAFTPDHLKK